MSYRAHCDKIGLAAEHEIAAEEWLIGAAQNGLEPPPLPTGQEDATRAHEIRDLMRTDPDSYWRDKSLQRELHQIIQRQADIDDEASPVKPAATA